MSLSGRARAEAILQQRQPELIERLVSASIKTTDYRKHDARALFELMIPNDLKDSLAQIANVILVVDAESSEYPWELMNDGGDRPLCTRMGMVRQLQTGTYRTRIAATTVRTAFVLGNPLVSPPFSSLPGAEQEAVAVYERLKDRFAVELLTGQPTALAVLGRLFAQPYRVVHIAGHGYYEPPQAAGERSRSGVVLDNGVFLTAVEIGQMLQVPELVFLNCCSLGQIGPEHARDVEFNRLAASVSRELIEMGVRAVVAAGWAVRDGDAKTFASAFYQEMLSGATFGTALREARRLTFEQSEGSNTWGAYQAYGDPDFVLEPNQQQQGDVDLIAPEEMVDRLETLRRGARSAGERPNSAERGVKDLKDLEDAVPKEWLERCDVLMALGLAYGEASALPQAIDHLERALDTGELDSGATLKAVEQLANFQVRDACARARAAAGEADAGTRQQAIEEARAAMRRIEALQSIKRTSERWSLLGSAHKRLAQLTAWPDAREAWAESARCYRHAYELGLPRGVDPYPLLNWLGLAAAQGESLPNADDLLEQAEVAARKRFEQVRDPVDAVFDAVALPDIAVVRALFTGTLDTAGETRDCEIGRIVDLYRDAFDRTGATPRQRDSALAQLTLLSQLLGGESERRTLAREALDEIHRHLIGRVAV